MDEAVGTDRWTSFLFSLGDTEKYQLMSFSVHFWFPQQTYQGFPQPGALLPTRSLPLLGQQGASDSLTSPHIYWPSAQERLGQSLRFVVLNPGERRCNTPPARRITIVDPKQHANTLIGAASHCDDSDEVDQARRHVVRAGQYVQF